MLSEQNKVYYINNLENDVYRLDAEGFTRDTGEKRCILRNLTDGKRWDMPTKDLEEVRLIDGVVTKVWTKQPVGWFPKKQDDVNYPGYTNDPRKEPSYRDRVGFNRQTSRMPAINRFNR